VGQSGDVSRETSPMLHRKINPPFELSGRWLKQLKNKAKKRFFRSVFC